MRSEHTRTQIDIAESAQLSIVYASIGWNDHLIVSAEFQRILDMADGKTIFDKVELNLTRVQAEALIASITKVLEKIDTEEIEDNLLGETQAYLLVSEGEFL